MVCVEMSGFFFLKVKQYFAGGSVVKTASNARVGSLVRELDPMGHKTWSKKKILFKKVEQKSPSKFLV